MKHLLGFIFLVMVCGLLSMSPSQAADCTTAAKAYHTSGALADAQAYIGCMELADGEVVAKVFTIGELTPKVAVETKCPVVQPIGGVRNPGGGTPNPGNPNGMETIIAELLKFKTQYGIPDGAWLAASSSLADPNAYKVLVNKDVEDLDLKAFPNFELSPKSYGLKLGTSQYWLDQKAYADFSTDLEMSVE